MTLIPSYTLILTHSLTLLVTSAILIVNPSFVTSAAPVWMLGEAMHIRDTAAFSTASEPLACLALVLAVSAIIEALFVDGLIGIGVNRSTSSAKSNTGTTSTSSDSDGVPGDGAALSETGIQAFAERAAILHHAQGQWMSLSTLKTLLYGLTAIFFYLASQRTAAAASPPPSFVGSTFASDLDQSSPAGRAGVWAGLQLLNNRVTFVGALTEMFFAGYLYTVLKEERKELAVRITARRREEDERMERAEL
jgi:hypothetical protein